MTQSRGWHWLAIPGLLVLLVVGCAPRLANAPSPTPSLTPGVVLGAAPLGPALPPPTAALPPTSKEAVTPAPSAARIPPPTAAPAGTATTSRPVPPKVGAVAADFTLRDLNGRAVTLSDLRGRKVMVNFWATWCGPCRYEIPFMVKLYSEIRDQGFEIVAVNLREDTAKVGAFVQEFGMTFPILLDPAAQVGAAYFVRGIPTSVFIDEQGVIVAVHTGALTDDLLRQYVSALMQ